MTSESGTSPFEHRSMVIARRFIQTVVIVDDKASLQSQPQEPKSTLTRPEYEDTTNVDHSGSNDSTPDSNETGLDAKTVIDRFAQLGAVCAVIDPTGVDEFEDLVPKAAEVSDIVVLDWIVTDNQGDDTLSVIKHILERDEFRSRLRLIAIYTSSPALSTIADRLRELVDQHYSGHKLITPNDYCISKGPVRLVVFAKPGTNTLGPNALQAEEIREVDLPDRLVSEFSEMTTGLMSNVALEGISAVRDNIHRLLMKFRRDLDPAYLGHRLIIPNPPDAEDHVVQALGNEVLSVLENAQPGMQASGQPIEDWLEDEMHNGLDIYVPLKDLWKNHDSYLQSLKALLDKGRDGVDDSHRPSNGQWQKIRARATEVFVDRPQRAAELNQEFAVLLGLKTYYLDSPPLLTLGTILFDCEAENEPGQYLICLQPKCDSVRLRGETAFPLLPLSEPGQQDRFYFVVKEPEEGRWLQFTYDPKPRQLTMRSFTPNKYPPGEVRGVPCLDRFGFNDTNGRKYLWIAELREEHALEVASRVGGQLSRPGPNHAEWLRLKHPRT